MFFGVVECGVVGVVEVEVVEVGVDEVNCCVKHEVG
jgi:hypothetical protein